MGEASVEQFGEVVGKVWGVLGAAGEKAEIGVFVCEIGFVGIGCDERDEFAGYADTVVGWWDGAVASGHSDDYM